MFQSLFVDQFGQLLVAFLVMRSHEEFETIDVIHNKLNTGIVVLVGCLFVFADRIGIAHGSRTCTFLFHVGSSYELDTWNVTFLQRIIINVLQIGHTVVTIHLQGGKDNGTFLVEFVHGLFCQCIDGILETVVLCIHQNTNLILIGTFTQGHEPIFEFTEFTHLFDGQFTPLFRCFGQQIIGRDGGGFEDGIGQILVCFGVINRA